MSHKIIECYEEMQKLKKLIVIKEQEAVKVGKELMDLRNRYTELKNKIYKDINNE